MAIRARSGLARARVTTSDRISPRESASQALSDPKGNRRRNTATAPPFGADSRVEQGSFVYRINLANAWLIGVTCRRAVDDYVFVLCPRVLEFLGRASGRCVWKSFPLPTHHQVVAAADRLEAMADEILKFMQVLFVGGL